MVRTRDGVLLAFGGILTEFCLVSRLMSILDGTEDDVVAAVVIVFDLCGVVAGVLLLLL